MNKTISMLHSLSMGVAFVGVISYILGFEYGWVALAIGALVLFMVRLYVRARTTDKNQMRLLSIMMFGAVLLLSAAYLMYSGRHYWVIPLMIDALVELYVSYRMRG